MSSGRLTHFQSRLYLCQKTYVSPEKYVLRAVTTVRIVLIQRDGSLAVIAVVYVTIVCGCRLVGKR